MLTFFNRLKCFNVKIKSKGVTLIEMLTAVAIFGITIGAISGIFISAVRTQRRTLATQEILDQTSYVLEYMGRAIRMARKELNCPPEGASCLCLSQNGLNYEITDIVPGVPGLKFIDYRGFCKGFFLQDGQLKDYERGRTPNEVLPLTSENLQVNLNSLNIGPAESWDQDDNLQPRVTIFLEILGREQSKLQIQTSISQRSLDVLR